MEIPKSLTTLFRKREQRVLRHFDQAKMLGHAIETGIHQHNFLAYSARDDMVKGIGMPTKFPANIAFFEIHTPTFVSTITNPCVTHDFCTMNNKKTWIILGAESGLAPAATKYLTGRGQHVVALETATLLTDPAAIIGISRRYGTINYIINNANYGLFHNTQPDIKAAVAITIGRLSALTHRDNKDFPIVIINLPPQLCLATLDDPATKTELLHQMQLFLQLMKRELEQLGQPFRFIEPGERLFELSQN